MNRIKDLRKEKRMNQAELGEALHISQGMVSAYENEKTPLTAELITLFAEYFGVSADYLLGREQEASQINSSAILPRPEVTPDKSVLSDIEFALAGEIHGLTDNEKLDVLDYVRFKKAKKNDAK